MYRGDSSRRLRPTLRLMRVVVATVLFLLAQTAQPEAGVTGYVLAPDGTPVSDGTVTVTFRFPLATASIERSGRFRVLPPRPGTYDLVVTVPGFALYRLSVVVPASRSLRLPVIRLSRGSYFRVRLVTPAGDPIVIPLIRRRLLDATGHAILDTPADRTSDSTDADGAITIGPLPPGMLTAAVDMPLFAQTRLPDVAISEADKILDGGTVVVQQPGAVLNVDLVDGEGAPVPNQYVFLDDARPQSPLVFRPVETDLHGRATFDRLAPGRYRLQAMAIDRCANARLRTSRDVPMPGSGLVAIRLVIGGRAAFRISSPLGPVRGAAIAAEPDVPRPAAPLVRGPMVSGCVGSTNADGRAMLPNFPPGPARIDVRLTNSTYERRIDVPTDGHEIAIDIPDGFLPVRVVSAVTNQTMAGATIAWTSSGGRAEATTTAAGEALLEGVGAEAGTLAATAPGYQDAEEQLSEPPGVPHTIALTPVRPIRNVTARVMTISGDPIPDAVVELVSAIAAAVPRVGVTGRTGVIVFADVPPSSARLVANADGFAPSATRIGSAASDVVLTLVPGYRVIATVELPTAAGRQRVRVMNDANASMDDSLDSETDRALEPPGRVSLGPLAAGSYTIEVDGAAGRREQRFRIIDRDAFVAFR